MVSSHHQRVTRAVAAVTDFVRSFALAAFLAVAAPAGAVPITVMDWNLYFGADATTVVAAPTPADVPPIVKAAFQQAKSNDFNLRVGAIADEIVRTTPHLIGLQEAAMINAVSTVPATFGQTTYSRDFVQILIAELASRGLGYTAAVTHTGFSVPLPSGNSLATIEELVTLTDRDVILRRNDVTITSTKEATFVNDLTFPTVGGGLKSNRGYVAVDAVVDGVPFRFVSTHLELPSPVQPAQLGEILAATGDASRLILVGDFNSRADGLDTPTYANALAAGFSDVWARLGIGPGFTCCELAGLDNPAPLLDERIDFILHRGFGIDPLAVDLLGETPFRGSAPFYASDHAGLVATLAIAVAEPGSVALLAVAMLALCWARRRRQA